MNQKKISDLNNLLEGIAIKVGEFTEAITGSSKQIDVFGKSIDSKIVSLNESIGALTNVIKGENEQLSKNLRGLFEEVKDEIKNFKEEVKISDIKETLASLQKLIQIPEKKVINETVEKVIKEIYEITRDLKDLK